MLDDFIGEQYVAVKILKNSIKNNKLVHAYLFETNEYDKSDLFIYAFIKSLLCPNNFFAYKKCNDCNICKQISDGNYPEIKVINPDGLWIKKDQLDELQFEFNKKAVIGDKKIYIINEAEKMNSQASNSILKFLEEPVPNVIAILVTNNVYQLLDTIISRCQVISLKKNIDKNKNEIELISNLLIDDQNKRLDFINEEKSIDFIKFIKNFILYYENNKIDTLLYTDKMWFSEINDKEKNIFAYGVILLFYKDVLNIKINRNIEIFSDDIDNLSKISKNRSINEIINIINIIISTKNKIRNNVNLNLLMDNFILQLEGR